MTQKKNQIFFDYTGTIEYVGKKEKITEQFWKREIWLNVDLSTEQYPNNQTMSFQASGKKMDLLNGLNVGEDVTIGFKINCNKAKGGDRIFTNLNVVSVNGKYKVEEGQSGGGEALNFNPEESSDLPF